MNMAMQKEAKRQEYLSVAKREAEFKLANSAEQRVSTIRSRNNAARVVCSAFALL